MSIRRLWKLTVLIGFVLLLSSCTRETGSILQPDLVIYTALEEAVYKPVIKEFEERTGYLISVQHGSSRELKESFGASGGKGKQDLDLIFGVGAETLEELKEYLLPYESSQEVWIDDLYRSADDTWTGFSSLPLVIMYNTNVVTYRELPQGFMSLLEPRWKGRIAFLDPEISDTYSNALVTAVHACGDETQYLKRFMENIDYETLSGPDQVNAGIVDGRYSLGVTLEESAQALRLSGADVDYVYPCEGTSALPDGTAILKGCRRQRAAEEFLDFTISLDVQRILVSDMNRRSVRTDVPPLFGLAPISDLDLVTMDVKMLSREKAAVMAKWDAILKEHETGEDG